MWLPWGWLLAHNDEFIWQWRPETDQLEFIRRPTGPAKLSPTGQHLAILSAPDERYGNIFSEIIVMPLNGDPAISLRQQMRRAIETGTIDPTYATFPLIAGSARGLKWSAKGETIAVRMYPGTWETYIYPALLMDTSGSVMILQGLPDGIPHGRDCYLGSLGGNTSLLDWWWLREDSTFAIYGLCANDSDDEREEVDIVFGLDGVFLRVEPFSWSEDDSAGVALVRTAHGGDQLADRVLIEWSPTRRYALVIDRDESWIGSYDQGEHRLREFRFDLSQLQSSAGRESEFEHALRSFGSDLHWDIYWYDDRTTAAIAQRNETIVGGFVLDLVEGIAFALELGPPEYWPCQWTGSWRPDEPYFQLTVGRRGFHLLTFGPDGQITGVVRITGDPDWAAAPSHRAAWSPNGEWFAIGGDPQPSWCVYGP